MIPLFLRIMVQAGKILQEVITAEATAPATTAEEILPVETITVAGTALVEVITAEEIPLAGTTTAEEIPLVETITAEETLLVEMTTAEEIPLAEMAAAITPSLTMVEMAAAKILPQKA